MAKTIKARLHDLEAGNPDKPFLVIRQSWNDANLWHVGKRENDPMTWDQVEALIESKYADHDIIKMHYVDDWKARHDTD